MDFAELMATRWSCRAFRPDDVPEDVLTGVFRVAQRTASWCNTQPWQVHLLGGEATQWFAKELTEHVIANPAPEEQSPDYPLPGRDQGEYLERRRAAGYALYASLGIDKSDVAGRAAAMLDNYSFFGAPHVAVITSDRSQGTYGAVDCGAYVANLMNAAHDVGLAAIAQGAIGVYAGRVRELLELPEDRVVVCGVAIGFADEEHPVNEFRTVRAELSGLVRQVRP
jgi:nitroreductase